MGGFTGRAGGLTFAVGVSAEVALRCRRCMNDLTLLRSFVKYSRTCDSEQPAWGTQ